MSPRFRPLSVHAYGPTPFVGLFRRTLCEAFSAEGPHANAIVSAVHTEVTCRECLRRSGSPRPGHSL